MISGWSKEKNMNGKVIVILFSFMTLLMNGCASSVFTVEMDQSGFKIINGPFDRNVLENDPMFTWFKPNYDQYVPDTATMQEVKLLVHDIHFVVVLGTWCGDSRREVPKQFKIFDVAGVSDSRIEMHGVDRSKKSQDGTTDKFNVLRVPTLIVMRGEEELGRIVENPRVSQEKDLLRMLQK